MQELSLKLNYRLLSENELDPSEIELLNTAKQISANAYAPYSQFKVGAALQCYDGTIMTGINLENASYPLSVCAEASLASAYRKSGSSSAIRLIAISVTSKNGNIDYPVMPCGGCRQILSEIEQGQQPITLLMQGDRGDIMQISGISNLIPLAFSGKELD